MRTPYAAPLHATTAPLSSEVVHVSRWISPDGAPPAVRVNEPVLGAVLAALKAKAGRGMKGKVAEALIEELRAAGALEEKTITVARLKASGGQEVVEDQIE